MERNEAMRSMEAAGSSEALITFYQTTGLTSQNTVIFILTTMGTLNLTQTDECLRTKFQPKTEKPTGGYRKMHNENPH
jgi:hypothetical protein